MAIDHVQLAILAGGEDRARAFYCGVLGMTEVPKPPALAARGGLWLQAGDIRLHLGVETPFAPARKAHPAFAVADVAAFLARAGLVAPLDDAEIPGAVRAYVDDPFGNRIELIAWGHGPIADV
jgi:catechol 2,3-dioxygenase-like lactoylglutathione lyase family enzyme